MLMFTTQIAKATLVHLIIHVGIDIVMHRVLQI